MIHFHVGICVALLVVFIHGISTMPLKKEISASIDLTDKWKSKYHEQESGAKQLNSSAKIDSVNTEISASSGGYKGYVRNGFNNAKGVAKASIDMKLNKKKGVSVNVELPSGSANAGAVGASVDLSTRVDARLTDKGKGLKAAISGPSASVKLGPVGVGIKAGLGVKVYGDKKKKIGAEIDTPIGSFGAVAGCVSEICIFACVSVRIC